mmetsp:Transcript_3058/g.9439  ORF Transcript_3058/g.9439 Transcript_3058/m.9439 type:complete len:318 (+) Transcript_3058:1134-2087(+)
MAAVSAKRSTGSRHSSPSVSESPARSTVSCFASAVVDGRACAEGDTGDVISVSDGVGLSSAPSSSPLISVRVSELLSTPPVRIMLSSNSMLGMPRSSLRERTAPASSSFSSSQRGEGTMKGYSANWSTAGMTDAPTLHRHQWWSWSRGNPRHSDTRMPITTENWLRVPNAPFKCGGATSFRYMGTTTVAPPQPRPTMKRERTIRTTPFAMKARMPASAKGIAISARKARRPMASAIRPAVSAPNKPPIAKIDTATENSNPLRSRSSFMYFSGWFSALVARPNCKAPNTPPTVERRMCRVQRGFEGSRGVSSEGIPNW